MGDNPFAQYGKQEDEWFNVTESQLYCLMCGAKSTKGHYDDKESLLQWRCPNGHHNELNYRL